MKVDMKRQLKINKEVSPIKIKDDIKPTINQTCEFRRQRREQERKSIINKLKIM